MIVYTIVDRGESTQDSGNRFSMSEVSRIGTIHSSSNEVLLPASLLTHVPSRLLVEELGVRVNVYIVADDGPSPTDVDPDTCWNTCGAFGTDGQTTPGAHHSGYCPLNRAE